MSYPAPKSVDLGRLSLDEFEEICKRYVAEHERRFAVYHQRGTIQVPEQSRGSFVAVGGIVDHKRLYGRTYPGRRP